MSKSVIKKPWGKVHIHYESPDGKVQFKTLHINNGECTSLAYHKNRDEIIFPLDSNALLNNGEKDIKLKQHFMQKINSGKIHRYKASGGNTVLAELDCGDPLDIIRVEDKYNRELGNGNGVKKTKKVETPKVVEVEEKKIDV